MDSQLPQSSSKSQTTPGLIRFPQETLVLCVVSVLDVAMTYRLLTRGDVRFVESNPLAAYFLNRWGIKGMAYFKAAMTVLVCFITQIIARKDAVIARRLLGTATLIIVGVVIYSVWMHFNNISPDSIQLHFLTLGVIIPRCAAVV
jgi:hypothetical protein